MRRARMDPRRGPARQRFAPGPSFGVKTAEAGGGLANTPAKRPDKSQAGAIVLRFLPKDAYMQATSGRDSE